jgi:hypothetical protein
VRQSDGARRCRLRTAFRVQLRSRIAPVALAVALAASAARAEPVTLRLDPAQSRVRFSLDALAHTIHGSLRVTRGELRFDPAAGTAAGEVVVDARSAETGNGSRDRKMHQTVLESGRYPEIVFTAKTFRRLARQGEPLRARGRADPARRIPSGDAAVVPAPANALRHGTGGDSLRQMGTEDPQSPAARRQGGGSRPRRRERSSGRCAV